MRKGLAPVRASEYAEKEEKKEEATEGLCSSIGIVLGFSVHSFFEGLALGMGEDLPTVLSLFVGGALHKWAESLAIVSDYELDRLW